MKEREKRVKQKEAARKQIVLRIAPSLWEDIAEWAEEDFRSINGQIEYILSEAVKKRKRE
ncbi:MAG: Arc family DNA-binding protein [Ruminococcus sp.]|nr:Arc family DNA-binding protein [Ruminococcus sp.]